MTSTKKLVTVTKAKMVQSTNVPASLVTLMTASVSVVVVQLLNKQWKSTTTTLFTFVAKITTKDLIHTSSPTPQFNKIVTNSFLSR